MLIVTTHSRHRDESMAHSIIITQFSLKYNDANKLTSRH